IRTMVGEETTARRPRAGIPRLAAFINYAAIDAELARRVADDLAKSGIPAWVDDDPGLPDSQWASGVQPGLVECSHMIVVLSTLSAQSPDVQKNWVTFKGLRKPIIVAMVEECPVPDELRRSPRFAIGTDYRAALRQIVQALSG
ncbi:MAG: toll/interleukin-1 receptor domain-containing protein, partial [Anaerolineae bacterium]|nr:toll/interleukin-1 receptor domain-containing protein [Anaerolineae bacterium]